MEIIYFTAAAIVLYLASDWIVNLIEKKRGERLANRSILFFVIIFTLAVITFNVIQHFTQGVESEDRAAPAPASLKTTKTP